jgi:DNA helicase-2/ATP-dependent DNA helicase PcrA
MDLNAIIGALNPEQLEAVKIKDGPVMVFAGAGTGKTKTLTSRVAYLIGYHKVNPQDILAITFTKKATQEMRDRLAFMLEHYPSGLSIDTIHAMCAKILRRYIDHLGYKRSFTIIDDEESQKLMTKIYKDNNIDRKHLTAKAALNMISAFKNGQKELIGQVKEIYDLYQAELKLQNLVDFDDLLVLTEKLLADDKEVRSFYQNLFKYVLVDEFQDTNVIQYHIIRMITEKSHNVFVVGDDDQSIYSFRGACVDNMFRFQKDFPEAQKVILNQNYRSSNAILKGSNCLIKNNQKREVKELFSSVDGNNRDVTIVDHYNQDEEVRYVTNEITRLVKQGYKYEEIAVLYRSNVISRNFELGFLEERIPYNIYGGFSYLKRKEIKDIMSYLQLIIDPTNVYHFSRIINEPSRGIGEKTIDKIRQYVKETGLDIFDAIAALDAEIPAAKAVELLKFKDMIVDFRNKIENMPLPEFLDYMIVTSGYKDMLLQEDEAEINRMNNVLEFKSILLQMDQDYDGLAQIDKLKYGFDELVLSEANAVDEASKKKSGVVLSTIHSVKGLEFRVVFVVALEEGIFPNQSSSLVPEELEEERRVAYVAFTRAKEKIYLTCANRRLIYGRWMGNKKSRFLYEYLGKDNNRDTSAIEEMTSYLDSKASDESSNEIKAGVRVNHRTFGDGLVIACDNSFVQVLFDRDGSLRKIMVGHPSLTRK